mmetsp:Transcript_92854/g.258226  ORF Transcript_92854/g.258226 Transcript_92854/m.258226 type:complete len:211 (-) Transcript_92854:30-662(-)
MVAPGPTEAMPRRMRTSTTIARSASTPFRTPRCSCATTPSAAAVSTSGSSSRRSVRSAGRWSGPGRVSALRQPWRVLAPFSSRRLKLSSPPPRLTLRDASGGSCAWHTTSGACTILARRGTTSSSSTSSTRWSSWRKGWLCTSCGVMCICSWTESATGARHGVQAGFWRPSTTRGCWRCSRAYSECRRATGQTLSLVGALVGQPRRPPAR